MKLPKHIIFDIKGVLLNKEPQHPSGYCIIDHGYTILKQCYEQKHTTGEPLHKLYVLSNMSTEKFNNAQQHYPHVFELFHGVLISAMTEYSKPDPRIFHHFLKHYNLKPNDCIFIDDSSENIQAAQTLGIYGIEFNNAETVQKMLQQLCIIE